ncbi:MAG: hypothetical protein WC004_03620, partial [Candidatus Absconditabacterales bacterium]
MNYAELLEQQPAINPKSPEVNSNDADKGPEVVPQNPDLGQLAGDVKLEQLDARVNPSTYEILQSDGTNLMQFLQNAERPERLEGLVNNLETIFQKVGVDYCHLEEPEAKHMATGIVCSIIDSLTGERNTGSVQPAQPAEGDKTKPAAGQFDALGAVFGNISKMFGGKAGSGMEHMLGDMFGQLVGVFGGADVLRQRLKSVFLLIELTRKSREILCPRDAAGKIDASNSVCTRDNSLIHNPKLFVGSSRIVEVAIKADKDVIQPENIHTLADFQKAIQITQGTTMVQYGLLDLLGLRPISVAGAQAIAAQDYFADIDAAALEKATSAPGAKQKLATKVLDGLETAVAQGKSFQTSRKTNRTALETGGLKGQVQEWMKALEPLSDPNDPESMYTTFNKWINLICGLLTGTAFSEDLYDPKATDLGAGLSDGSVLSGDERKKITDGVLEGAAVGGVLYHATNVILKGESAYQYDAINPSDSNDQQLSIGLMQWHGPRAGELIANMGALDREIVLDPAKGLGPDFGAFVLDTKPNGRWLETSKRGAMVDNKWVPNEFEEDGTPLAEWKKNRIPLMKQLLASDLAKQVMNNQLKTDIESYIPEVRDALGITNTDDNLTLDEKKAIVMGCRFYNAGPQRTTRLLSGLDKPVTLEAIKDAA